MKLYKMSILDFYILLIFVVWSGLILYVFKYNVDVIKTNSINLAKYSAQVSFEKDISYRSWAAKHGGVYVWVDAQTSPNPNLAHIPLRDIDVREANRTLTLMNPAYMIRQVMDWQENKDSISTKITSLKPIRKENAPDEWERKMLERFERGEREIYEVIDNNGMYLRAMKAFITEKPCLKCHAAQGYVEGDVRGGISTTINMKNLLSIENAAISQQKSTSGLIWLFGVFGCILAYGHIDRYIKRWDSTKTELEKSNAHLLELMEGERVKRLENERLMIQQSKMAMMGEMIGAIAHQWRQPLNSLGLEIQDLALAHRFGELNEGYVEKFRIDSMDLIKSMSRTIDDFRNFFIPSADTESFCIEFAIQETIYILSAQLHNNQVKINFSTDNEHHMVGYKNELKQVVINIILNAKDAILHRGNKSGVIDVNTSSSESVARIVISDNGGGIDPAIVDRIFEPYFTTKEQGSGTGIGLYMSKEIVERHIHGKIYCENIDGGARFVIEIPIAS